MKNTDSQSMRQGIVLTEYQKAENSADSLKNEVSALLATLESMMEQPASAPDKEDIL